MGDFGIDVPASLAHLVRDVKFLTTLSDSDTAEYGGRALDRLNARFEVINQRDELSEAVFRIRIEIAWERMLIAAKDAPFVAAQVANLAKRFELNGDAYTHFSAKPGIDPTNNLAEQAIRFVVIDRKLTEGRRC